MSSEDRVLGSSTFPEAVTRRYLNIRPLGAGGMGEVFAADDSVLEMPVALKFIKGTGTQQRQLSKRFKREVRALVRMKHPNVVRILDFHEFDDICFYSMELANGSSLYDVLAANDISEYEAVYIVSQIAAGLEAAHEAGIVHRDIKPGNVVVAKDGSATLVDFGLVRFESIGELTELTQEGQFVGTLRYLSPEMAEGKAAGMESDVYQAGLLLYLALTGEHPFGQFSFNDVFSGSVFSGIVPPREHNSKISQEIAEITIRTLAKDPAERPSAAELAKFLTRWLNEREEKKDITFALAEDLDEGSSFLTFPSGKSTPASTTVSKKPAAEKPEGDSITINKSTVIAVSAGMVIGLVGLVCVFGFFLLLAFGAYQSATRANESVVTDAQLKLDIEPADAKVTVNGVFVPPEKWYSHDVASGPVWVKATSPGYVGQVVKGNAERGTLSRVFVRLVKVKGEEKAGKVWTNSVGMQFAYVPTGKFKAGCPADEKGSFPWESKQREVKINHGYWMGKFEVTLAQWHAVMKDTQTYQEWLNFYAKPAMAGQAPSVATLETSPYPVHYVTWTDAENFCRALSRKEGKAYRLPTEVEWEYACRAGTTEARYGKLDEIASWQGKTACHVGLKKENAWGLYDMLGNVWEWTADCDGPFPISNEVQALAARGLKPKIFRGGGAWGDERYCRAASRSGGPVDRRAGLVGFRVLRD